AAGAFQQEVQVEGSIAVGPVVRPAQDRTQAAAEVPRGRLKVHAAFARLERNELRELEAVRRVMADVDRRGELVAGLDVDAVAAESPTSILDQLLAGCHVPRRLWDLRVVRPQSGHH